MQEPAAAGGLAFHRLLSMPMSTHCTQLRYAPKMRLNAVAVQ